MLAKRPTPMTIREAIEAAKIVRPYVPLLREAEGGFSLVHLLFDALREDAPAQPFRLLSLLHHTTLEALAAEFNGGHPAEIAVALTNGLISNPIPDLMNFAFAIGLSTEKWGSDA